MSTVCMFIVGTPFYCRLSRRRSKHSGISSTFPFKYQYLHMCMITSQLIHGEASKWILYIYIEVLKHYSVGWFNDWVHFRSHCTSENADFVIWEVKFAYMKVDWSCRRPIAQVAHHPRFSML